MATRALRDYHPDQGTVRSGTQRSKYVGVTAGEQHFVANVFNLVKASTTATGVVPDTYFIMTEYDRDSRTAWIEPINLDDPELLETAKAAFRSAEDRS